MIKTDTTLDQDCGTESNCVSMYSVHCRVIVDNKSEFYHHEVNVNNLFEIIGFLLGANEQLQDTHAQSNGANSTRSERDARTDYT